MDEDNVISFIIKFNANISARPSASINSCVTKGKVHPITCHKGTEGE
jgi:hypothetical protein